MTILTILKAIVIAIPPPIRAFYYNGSNSPQRYPSL